MLTLIAALCAILLVEGKYLMPNTCETATKKAEEAYLMGKGNLKLSVQIGKEAHHKPNEHQLEKLALQAQQIQDYYQQGKRDRAAGDWNRDVRGTFTLCEKKLEVSKEKSKNPVKEFKKSLKDAKPAAWYRKPDDTKEVNYKRRTAFIEGAAQFNQPKVHVGRTTSKTRKPKERSRERSKLAEQHRLIDAAFRAGKAAGAP